MSDPFFDGAVFYFAAERREGAFQRFRDRFGLEPSPHVPFEIIDQATGKLVNQENDLADMIAYLDSHPARCFDFYLADQAGASFTFSYRPQGYHVMSIPYVLLDEAALLTLLRDFDAIYGWGAGEDAPPPDNLAVIRAAVKSVESPFLRYRDGKRMARAS